MKKFLSILVLVFTLSVSCFASSIFKLSLWDKISIPQADSVEGLDFGIIGSQTATNVGIQWVWIYAQSDDMTGVQGAFITNAKKIKGGQGGFLAYADKVEGYQGGLITYAEHIEGAQFGFINIAKNIKGSQFGFINLAFNMEKGFQFGLINYIQNGTLPIMVIINGTF